MRLTVTGSTLALGACIALAGLGLGPAQARLAAHAGKSSAGALAHGKALTATDKCNRCHSADLAGKKGFSPSLHASGVLREYNPQTFTRVLQTGITNDGGHVHPPMPMYKTMKPADAKALYTYLKTLK